MPNVVPFRRRGHARASDSVGGSGKQSSAVTSPPVSALIAAANGADSQDLRFRMRLMCDRSTDTPRARSRSAIASSSRLCSDMNSESCMGRNVYETHKKVKPLCAPPGMESADYAVHHPHDMVRKPKTKPNWRPSYLRQWREHAGKTLEEAAPKMRLSHSQLSRVERGLQKWDQDIIEAAALEYGCTPADIISRLPSSSDVPLPQRRLAKARG